MEKAKQWKDFTLEERVLFWAMNLSAEEIACKEGIANEEVLEICKKRDIKIRSLENRVVFDLVWLKHMTDEEVAKEIIRNLPTFTLAKVKEFREKYGFSENKSSSWSPYALRPHSEPDPSH